MKMKTVPTENYIRIWEQKGVKKEEKVKKVKKK